MWRRDFWQTLRNVLAVSAMPLMLGTVMWAKSQEEVLYTLTAPEGENPVAGLALDANGTLYGTAASGGSSYCGTVFALTRSRSGGWEESTLHNFACGPSDGKSPYSALVLDQSGDLYGTTVYGGSHDCGIVFELTRLPGGGWSESVIHDFGARDHGQVDGCHPYSSLVFDASGNLYGTTSVGGGGITEGSCQEGCGTVFQLSPAKGGGWTESVIHRFHGRNNDGENPYSGLAIDGSRNLYGTSFAGGTVFGGTIFELTPGKKGWKENVLHNFQGGRDGANPYAGLILSRGGVLYGTTSNGGSSNVGTVFKLRSDSGGQWKEIVLHSFAIGGNDGFYPFAGVVLDAYGNLFGTTEFGGARQQGQKGAGTVFRLTPGAGGRWKEKIVFDFSSKGAQGQRNPFGGLVSDAKGDLFGTAQPLVGLGGVIFEVIP